MSPPVIIAGAAAFGSAFAAAGFSIAAITTGAWIGVGISMVVSGLSMALQAGQKKSSSSFQSTSESITRSFRVAKAQREIVYGEVRKSGSIAYIYGTTDNQYLHTITRLASHEIEGIDEYIVNDESITLDMLDADGNVISGKYSGLLRLRPHLGATDQAADVFLMAESPEWTIYHKLQGVAYIYVRVKWNADIWAGGPPNISCWLRGAKVYDSRDTVARWTSNVALIARDFLINPFLVLQTDTSHIDDDIVTASANVCDEMVTTEAYVSTISSVSGSILSLTQENNRLFYQRGDRVTLTGSDLPDPLTTETNYFVIPYQRENTPRIKLASSLANALAGTTITLNDAGSGAMTISKNAEPRYHGGGMFLAGESARDDLEGVLSGMAGNAINSGGSWRILAGAYETSTLYLDEGDLVGEISVSTKVGRAERFNEVQGTYLSPINGGQAADYPLVTRDQYVTEDTLTLRRVLDLPVTQRPHTAQRIAMIALDKSRMDIVFKADFKLTAFPLQVGNNFYFSFPLYGWDEMVFEVTEWTFTTKDGAPIISITARQNDVNVYSWTSTNESPINPSTRTSLPNPFSVPVVTNIGIDSKQITTLGDDITFQIEISWQISGDAIVAAGGGYEIQYKKSAEETWAACGTVDGSATSTIIPQLEKDILYDIRIRAYNSLGVKSNWTLLEGYQAGQTVIADAEDWESQSITARDGDDWEADSEASEDWE